MERGLLSATCAVEKKRRRGVGGDLMRFFLQAQVHGFDVGVGQSKGCACASVRAGGVGLTGPFVALIARRAQRGSAISQTRVSAAI